MQNRRQGVQLIFAGVAVIVLVLGVGFFLMNRPGGGAASASSPAGDSTAVLVAQQAIPAGTVFKSGQDLGPFFSVKHVPGSLVPFGAYSSVSQIASLAKSQQTCGPIQTPGCLGQITTSQTIYQGTPVVSGMFSTLGQFRQSAGPAFSVPYGYVGIAVNFDAVNSVLGSISPGDDVDLIASYRGGKLPDNVKAPPQTQYVLNDIRVLAVNGPAAPPGQSSTNNSSSSTSTSTAGQSNAGGTVILLVRFQQGLVIQHLKDFGWQMSVVLRSAKETDIRHFKTLPVTDKWFFVKTSNPLKTNPGY